MSKTLSQIQTIVRWEARDEGLDLTGTTLLALANLIYRRMANLSDWQELTREDTSLSTTAGTASYTWPSVLFSNVTHVEMQSPAEGYKYETVPAATSEYLWQKYREYPDGFPIAYKRMHNGTNNIITFCPAPSVSSLAIRITGTIEPTELAAGSSTTVWIQSSMDDAFAYLIAADVAAKREYPQRAEVLVGRAAELLGRLAGREITPSELRASVGGGMPDA